MLVFFGSKKENKIFKKLEIYEVSLIIIIKRDEQLDMGEKQNEAFLEIFVQPKIILVSLSSTDAIDKKLNGDIVMPK